MSWKCREVICQECQERDEYSAYLGGGSFGGGG